MSLKAKRLEGKTAVITGGTTGIGFATAQVFLAHGAKVIITGQDQERLNSAVEKLKGEFKSDTIHGVRADVRSIEQLSALAETTGKLFNSHLDILFVNSGVAGQGKAFEEFDEQEFDFTFNVNFKGAFFTVQKLAPLLSNGSSVIFNLSTVQSRPLPALSVYAATKAAGRSLVRSLAVHLAPRGIRVNAISPGIVPTEIGKHSQDFDKTKQLIEGLVTATPLKRPGTPEEIANTTLFLASDDSSYLTGSDIYIDGGYSA